MYPIVYEQGEDGGWGAYCPDLPGLGVAAETLEEVEQLITEGIPIHINALREFGFPVPPPSQEVICASTLSESASSQGKT